MNNYKYIFVLAALLVAIGGCDLLGNQQPHGSLNFKGGIKTAGNLQSAVNGMYSALQLANGDNNAEFLFGNDYETDDVVFTGSFPTFQDIFQQQMHKDNGSITAMWRGAYRTINDANIILQSINNNDFSSLSDAQKNSIQGQALYVRSLEYYLLVDNFALPASAGESNPGVPLQLEAVTSPSDFKKPSRSSIMQVYEQITGDLQTAADLLQPAGGNPRNQGNKGAAQGLIARIALVRGNYTKAAAYSDSVITSGNFTLLPDVTTYFRSEGSSEALFSIQMTQSDTPDALNTSITAEYNPNQRGDVHIGPAYVTALKKELNARQKAAIKSADATAHDTRVTELIVKGTNLNNPENIDGIAVGSDYSYKYESSANADDNIPIMRYSEIILTRAEALARLNGVNQESIKLLNQIRERAFNVQGGDESLIDYTSADFSSKQDLVDAILNQRFIELAFEGHHRTDLQRTKQDVRGTAYNAPNLVFPIPQTQTDSNPNIKQNPGY